MTVSTQEYGNQAIYVRDMPTPKHYKKLWLALMGLLIIALPTQSYAMAERPEQPWVIEGRERQRIANILQWQINKCDPWSKLEFEVNGVVLRPLAIVASNLQPVDTVNLPVNICNERVSLKSFSITIPDPRYIDINNDYTENPGKISDYRKWWYEHKLPEAFESISVPLPQSKTSVESYDAEGSKFPHLKKDPVFEGRFILDTPYSAWVAPIGGYAHYIIMNGASSFEAFSCLGHRLFDAHRNTYNLCDFKTLIAARQVEVKFFSFTVWPAGMALGNPTRYSEKDAAQVVLAGRAYIEDMVDK